MAGHNKFHMPEPKTASDKKSIAKAVIAKGPDAQGGVDPRMPPVSGKLGKLRHIHIEPAKNGYTVRSSHETHQDHMGPGGDQQHVFNDHKSMLKHITKTLGIKDGDGDDGEYA